MLHRQRILAADSTRKLPAKVFGAVCSAGDAVAEVAGSVRENIKLRRGFRYFCAVQSPIVTLQYMCTQCAQYWYSTVHCSTGQLLYNLLAMLLLGRLMVGHTLVQT